MNRTKLMTVAAAAAVLISFASGPSRAADAPPKNWTAPAATIRAQQLVDETMSRHPELLSMTLHGVPPGLQDVYTMFAGSFPERIGNPDDPDDIDVTKKGITILDPRWKRSKDPVKKFVVLMPLRDAAGDNVGLVVYAFKEPVRPNTSAGERNYFDQAAALRDELQGHISSYATLFERAGKP